MNLGDSIRVTLLTVALAARAWAGESVTMRLISWTSLLWVFCRPARSLSNKPMS